MPKTIGDFVLSLLGWPVTDASCSACGPTDETPDPDAETSCRDPAGPSSTAAGAIGCCGATRSRGPFHDHDAAAVRADEAQKEPSPIACNLTSRQRQEWRDEIAGSVLKGLEEIREMEDGFAFRFPGGEAVDEKLGVLSRWIAGERKCCPFYRFEVIVEPEHGPLWLRLRGREGVKRYTASELRDFDSTVPGSESLREWFERG